MLGEMSVRRLSTSDLDSAVEVLSLAFAEDPFVIWNFEHRVAALSPVAFRITAGLLTEAGTAFGYFEGDSIVGVALYQAPGETFKLGSMLRSGAEIVYRSLGRTTLRMTHAFGETERFKQDCMGDTPYFYLDTVAVHPRHARRGFGSALITDSLKQVRGQRREPCFLISQPHNLDYYLKRGFKSVRDRLLPKCNVRFHGLLEKSAAGEG